MCREVNSMEDFLHLLRVRRDFVEPVVHPPSPDNNLLNHDSSPDGNRCQVVIR